MPVINAIEFLSACLVAGLGIFLASEAFLRLRRHFTRQSLSHGLAAMGGIVAALSGGYWATLVARW